MAEIQATLPLQSDATLPTPPSEATALSVPEREPQRGALADLRQHAMSVPVEVMLAGLAEYADRRKAFRKWLLSILIRGVHYGFPPGTEPKLDEDGNAWVWSGKKQKEVLVKKEQWQSKASFYKAGADLVCDVLGVRDEYQADLEAWQQAGSRVGTFVMACHLFSRATSELLGEGRGARRVEKDDENKAIKMAKKSAKVDAVLNTYGLADLFTQDMEDYGQPPHDNPTPRADAPQAKSRGERGGEITAKQLKDAMNNWQAYQREEDVSGKGWEEFVQRNTGDTFDVWKPSQWNATRLHAVLLAIQVETTGRND